MWAELTYGVDVYPLFYALWGGVLLYWIVLAGMAVRSLSRARPGRASGGLWRRAPATLVESVFQRGAWRNRAAGAMHAGLMVGWLLVLVGFLVTHYVAPRGEPWRQSGTVHALVDVGAVFAVGGLVVAGWRRARGRIPAAPLDVGLWALLMVAALAGLSAQGLIVAIAQPPWRKAALISAALAGAFSGLPEATLRSAYGAAWSLLHAALLGMAVLLPLTKWRHMVLAPWSLLTRPQQPLARLAPCDLEGPEPYGARRPQDLARKERLDVWACTRCGRCTGACPATAAGRALDPLAIVQCLADAQGPRPLAEQVGEAALWDCTTCMACVEVCPVGIAPLDMVVDLRRERVLDAGVFPSAAAVAFRGLERRGNPWGLMVAADPELPVLAERERCEVLLWLGCMGRQDPRARRAARALVAVLHHAGVSVATLGDREGCCGDPARRMGNEYLWRETALAARSALARAGCAEIVTLCPHCANMLANEYADLNAPQAERPLARVSHATTYLAGLAHQGRLAIPSPLGDGAGEPRTITYHDPCYLSRGVGEVRAARDLLRMVPGVSLAELPRHGASSRCCGAGGGQMWLQESANRLEVDRVAEIAGSGAATCVTACPYCATLLGDGLQGAGRSAEVVDVVELLAEALGAIQPADRGRTGVAR